MKRLKNLAEYIGRAVPWQAQTPVFLVIFIAIGTLCSVPDETFPAGLTANQALEDFGVFLLFTALWTGIYAHFSREIDLFWLLAIFAVALLQEELNIWNNFLLLVSEPLGYEMTSKERQRGDVFMLAFVAVTLLGRFIFSRGFKSFLRIHITFFLFAFTTFQLLIHFVFAYHLQGAVVEQRLNFLREVAATHTDRFDFLCQSEGLSCLEFKGMPTDDVKSVSKSLSNVLSQSAASPLYVTTWIEVMRPSKEIFRGVDSNQKNLVALLHEGDQNRLVVDSHFSTELHSLISSSLLMFATTFGLVWFFGGMFMVMFHQSRVYRRTYGAKYRLTAAAPNLPSAG